jgi:hypothetical protein
VLSLVATITALNEQIKQLERQIATAMREHPDGQAVCTLADTTRHRRQPPRTRGDRRAITTLHSARALPAKNCAGTKQLTLTFTVSAARRRWGGRRVPFCAGRAAGPALIPAVAQRAIC